MWIAKYILWTAQRILWISVGILWITLVKTSVFPQKKPKSCGKLSIFVSKTVDKEAYPVDNCEVLAVNLGLILLITAYFLWITLLKLGVKLVQTCGKLR